jgi:hypothetical protein
MDSVNYVSVANRQLTCTLLIHYYLEAIMKSIWWVVAMLVLAFISLLANKALVTDQSHVDQTAVTRIQTGTATSSQTVTDR